MNTVYQGSGGSAPVLVKVLVRTTPDNMHRVWNRTLAIETHLEDQAVFDRDSGLPFNVCFLVKIRSCVSIVCEAWGGCLKPRGSWSLLK